MSGYATLVTDVIDEYNSNPASLSEKFRKISSLAEITTAKDFDLIIKKEKLMNFLFREKIVENGVFPELEEMMSQFFEIINNHKNLVQDDILQQKLRLSK